MKRIVKSCAVFAYVIRNTVYNYVIENAINSGAEIDIFYIREIYPIYNCYCIYPRIAWQIPGYSDILHDYKDYQDQLKDKE